MMPTKNAAAMLAEMSVTFQCDRLGAVVCAVGFGCVGVVMTV
jgi:hypothetical protein